MNPALMAGPIAWSFKRGLMWLVSDIRRLIIWTLRPGLWNVFYITLFGLNRIDGGQSHDSLRLVSLIYRPIVWIFVSGLWNIKTDHMNHHDGSINIWRTIMWTSAIVFSKKKHWSLGPWDCPLQCIHLTNYSTITSGLSSSRAIGTGLLNLLLFIHFLNHLCFHSVRISVDYRKALRLALLLPVAKGLLPIVSS